ncbi:HtaA domain-containing protein [Streptomyces sp. NPDC102340]|uniref:HtaA domain-containing protein n=1 Tax=unclassified Streptomyces TaxID=2593676 RepID=UPI003827C874
MTRPARRGVLSWPVKTSFVHYVRVIAAGTCEAADGAELDADGVFQFPLAGAERGDVAWSLRFDGRARFAAHHGFLDVELRGIELTLPTDARGGVLGVLVEGGERLAIVTTAPTAPTEGNGVIRWPGLVPHLTDAGAELFGSVYPPGQELAPLDALVLLDS